MSKNHKNNLINIANNKYNQLLSFLFFLLIAAPFSKPNGFLGLLLPIFFLGLLITTIYSFLNFKTLLLYLIVRIQVGGLDKESKKDNLGSR